MRWPCLLSGVFRTLKRQLQPEQRPFSYSTLHANASALQDHQALANAQAQTGAAKRLVGRHIGRFETVENLLLPLWCHTPTSVLHLNPKRLALLAQCQHDFSVGGEFDGVV